MSEVITPGSLPGKSTAKSVFVIFVVDNSGSMREDTGNGVSRIDAVNAAFRDLINSLQDKQISGADAFTIYISILTFNYDAEWLVKTAPVATYLFPQEGIPVSPYVTYYSKAYDDLCESLSSKALLAHEGKMSEPYIMLLTDGKPTPGDPYEEALERLLGNGWFVSAQRYAVLIGEDAVSSEEARSAVSGFVKRADKDSAGNIIGFVDGSSEGIINATDAAEILNAISTQTMVVVEGMTVRRVNPDSGNTGGTEIFTTPPEPGTGGFTGPLKFPGYEEGGFDDPDAGTLPF